MPHFPLPPPVLQYSKQLLFTGLVGMLFFAIVNAAFAQILTSTVLQAIDSGSALITIIFLGFLSTTVVAIAVNYLTSETADRRRVLYASIFGLVSNVLLWITVAYLFILRTYPDVIAAPATGDLLGDILMRGLFYLGAIPQVLSYFALYKIGNIIRFWIFTLLSYTALYTLFLYLFSTPSIYAAKKKYPK